MGSIGDSDSPRCGSSPQSAATLRRHLMVRIADFDSARVGSSPTASATWEPSLLGRRPFESVKKWLTFRFDF